MHVLHPALLPAHSCSRPSSTGQDFLLASLSGGMGVGEHYTHFFFFTLSGLGLFVFQLRQTSYVGCTERGSSQLQARSMRIDGACWSAGWICSFWVLTSWKVF